MKALIKIVLSTAILFAACESKTVDTIFCDFETITDSDLVLTNQKEFTFKNSWMLSNEESFSGGYSLKLAGNNNFGPNIMLPKAKSGSYVKITAWRKGNTNAKIVLSAAENRLFWFGSDKAVEKNENGWEKLVLHIEYTPIENGMLPNFYTWNPDTIPAYFDDITISFYEQRKFPVFSEDALNIYIDTFSISKLNEKRFKAFDAGILQTEDDDWVNAVLFYKNSITDAKIRLKGDWLDHLKGRKWSFRVKMKDEWAWNNLRLFSIQSPAARDFLNEWVAHKLFEQADVLTTTYDFVPITLNGESLGLYVFEEHFEKQLVESRKRREGPIMKFDETNFWTCRLYDKNLPQEEKKELPLFEACDIGAFKETKIEESPALKTQFEIARDLMYSFKYFKRKTSDIFDIEKLAKYFALIDLTKSFHGLAWINVRFYYNPVLCKLEPIAYDGYMETGVLDWTKRPIFGNPHNEEPPYNDHVLMMIYNIFGDADLVKLYYQALEKYSSEAFLDSFFTNYDEAIVKNEKMIALEFEGYKYDREFLYNNAKAIRKALPEYKKMIEKNPIFMPGNISSVKTPVRDYDTAYYEKLVPMMVKSFVEEKGESGASIIKIQNYNSEPIIILGTGTKPETMDYLYHPEPELPSFYTGANFETELETAGGTQYLFFMIKNNNKTFATPIRDYRYPVASSPYISLMENTPFPQDIYKVEGNEVIFSGNINTTKNIVIPKGYQVVFEAGTNLNLTKGALFLSYSPVVISGTKNQPVNIFSSDNTAGGFTVLQAKHKSTINYANFKSLNTFSYFGWTLTGAVNFYESEVEIANTQFIENKCEDALNIIRSEFYVKNSTFKSIYSDAFDSDFSIGKVEHTKFENIGNDAIDFSGSIVKISNCVIKNTGDKGISGGENSHLEVENTSIENCVIGVASKDKSLVITNLCSISKCDYGIAVFKKKPEFGAAVLEMNNFEINNCKTLHFIEINSTLFLNKREIQGREKDALAFFYATGNVD